jgi:putative ABC transport system permease protein
MEAITMTAFAGLIGFAIAVGFLALLNSLFGETEDFPFANPMVSIIQFLVSFLLMVGLSVLIGLIPANRAVKIKPIDALREE